MDKQAYLQEIDSVIANGKFKDNWSSLSQYQVPAWFKNEKFGIFIHWGPYCVPAFNNEWYSRNMYIQGTPEFEHHVKTYGAHKDFGYKDFIPLFKGEKFNAQEWAQLFKDAGARYVMPVAEHHEGFQMYKSELSHWNACEMGPKRDVLGELKAAIEEQGMTFCTSSHRAEHWFFMGHGKEFDSDIKEPLVCGDFYWPSMEEHDHQDIYSPSPTQEYLEDWLVRTCELIDTYRPKVLYFDWWVQHTAFKPYLKKFAAYYYNRAIEWGEEVVIEYKHDAFQFGTAVIDVERGKLADQKPYYWQTDTSISKNSWCYVDNSEYKTASSILCDLVDIVSKNGSLMLNVDPKADGSIPDISKQILAEIGNWLSANGEAIYDARLWRVAQEGPTKTVEGMFSEGENSEYTSEDIRFTTRGEYLYATVLRFPESGVVTIRSLAEHTNEKPALFHGVIKGVSVLGFDEIPAWERNGEALTIRTANVSSEYPVVFKILVD